MCWLPALQLQTPTNVASIVVHQALAKSLDRFNTAMNARPAHLQQQQQPGAAYQVQPGPSELTYDELTVRAACRADLEPFRHWVCLARICPRHHFLLQEGEDDPSDMCQSL